MTFVNPWIQWNAMHVLNLSLYSNHLHVRILKVRLTHMLHPNIRFLHNLEGPYCDNKDTTKIYSYILASSSVWPAKVETWFLFSHWRYRFFFSFFLFFLGGLGDSTSHCTEMHFASFLFGGFITAIVVNPPENKLAKRTSVHWELGNIN